MRRHSGPLYRVDARLRPHGASGPLVLTLEAFNDYLERSLRTWERMAFTRARVIFATGGFGPDVIEVIHHVLAMPVSPNALAAEVVAVRRQLEASRRRHDLKRGFGGLADLEFIVQYLQLVHAANHPEVLKPNFWDALLSLRRLGIVSSQTHTALRDAYDFLRTVEGRLRLIYNRSVDELPDNRFELERLARRLNYEASDPVSLVEQFLADAARHTTGARALFDQIVGANKGCAPEHSAPSTPQAAADRVE